MKTTLTEQDRKVLIRENERRKRGIGNNAKSKNKK